jgi:hypothetical protein
MLAGAATMRSSDRVWMRNDEIPNGFAADKHPFKWGPDVGDFGSPSGSLVENQAWNGIARGATGENESRSCVHIGRLIARSR